jgi:deoxyribose-phosphate aldolase
MQINKFIDHTLLKQDATQSKIEQLCQEARTYDFMSVCVNPSWVKTCSQLLTGSDVKVCTVIGFPLGATSTASKAYETEVALADGADEFDMVINIGYLKDGKYDLLVNDIKAVVKAAQGKVVKVIIETCLLTDEEKVTATQAVMEAQAHFVKTSTGFSTAGATFADVELMKKVTGDEILIKAAGGVRSIDDLHQMVKLGASRIGTSSGVALMQHQASQEGY